MTPDPFDQLGLPARFDLRPGEIESAYLSRSSRLHPDLVGSDAEAARAMAMLNEARRVLRDPEQRASALLERLGGPGKEQDKSLPTGFLMEIMAHRESMEESLAVEDERERARQLARWDAWAQERRGEEMAALGSLLAEAQAAEPAARTAILARARQRLNAWRYIERLREQLHEGRDV